MRIGIFGYSPLNFVTDIANRLVTEGHSVVVFTFTKKGILDQVNYKFDVVYIDSIEKSRVWKFGHFLLGLLYFNFRLLSIKYKDEIFSFKDFYQYIYNFKFAGQLVKLDCCNYQSLTMSNMWSLYLKPDCKIVSSFWGSDLNVAQSRVKKKNKNRIVEKSAIVTLQSIELEEVFLKKYDFGKDILVEKILFPVRHKFFELAEHAVKEESKYVRIAIGYNGSPNQNHISCIGALNNLSHEVKDVILVKLYLHYGGTEEYYKEVLREIEFTGMKYTISQDRLSISTLVQEKVNTDIFLILPSNDGFSASVSEALFTGGIVVTGDWLPYSRYKINDLAIQWVDKLENLSESINFVLENRDSLSVLSKSNRKKVLNTLDYNGSLFRWISILTTSHQV